MSVRHTSQAHSVTFQNSQHKQTFDQSVCAEMGGYTILGCVKNLESFGTFSTQSIGTSESGMDSNWKK